MFSPNGHALLAFLLTGSSDTNILRVSDSSRVSHNYNTLVLPESLQRLIWVDACFLGILYTEMMSCYPLTFVRFPVLLAYA